MLIACINYTNLLEIVISLFPNVSGISFQSMLILFQPSLMFASKSQAYPCED
jgi:hypothetical protein